MKPHIITLPLVMMLVFASRAQASTRYVDLNSLAPTPPYTSWSMAATNIQDAVDAAVDGDLVLVTNGVYEVGGRIVHADIINRLAVTKPIIVQSVNGFASTMIKGFQVPGTTNGSSAVRCVYLTNGASLIGFTLTNGATTISGGTITPQGRGGGLYAESTNALAEGCLIIGNAAYFSGGGVANATLTNCEIRWNFAGFAGSGGGGGGVFQSAVNGCIISSNRVFNGFGAGANFATLTDSSITGNLNLGGVSSSGGGGTSGSTLSNCVVSGNSSWFGGGVYGGSCQNSLIVSNSGRLAASTGGGCANANLRNCILYGNQAFQGGGASAGTLLNCTVIENMATNSGGGCMGSTAINSILYYNSSAGSTSNRSGGEIKFCCISPETPTEGNITNAPLFVDLVARNLKLQSNSPCINAGSDTYLTSVTDFDGLPRVAGGTVDIGAYEFQSPPSTLSYAWAQLYGLPIDGTADFDDPDGDGADNSHESRADTVPTNSMSVLRITDLLKLSSTVQVTWQAVATRKYWIERTTNFSGSAFMVVLTNQAGIGGVKTASDSTATNSASYFYRVGVQ